MGEASIVAMREGNPAQARAAAQPAHPCLPNPPPPLANLPRPPLPPTRRTPSRNPPPAADSP